MATPVMAMQTFTTADVSKHRDAKNGYWLIIENNVYDVTNFLDKHPGGSKILQRYAGKNATKAFWKFHKENVLKKQAERYKIGVISESARL